MPSVPSIDTEFRRAARTLQTPLAARFDQADWQQAFATFPHPSPEDERLLEAALWVGREARAHY